MIMQQQDNTLDSIAGIVGTLKNQASLMGHEVMEQVSHVLLAHSSKEQSSSFKSYQNAQLIRPKRRPLSEPT